MKNQLLISKGINEIQKHGMWKKTDIKNGEFSMINLDKLLEQWNLICSDFYRLNVLGTPPTNSYVET